jgi:hypothetical protein
LLAYLLRNQHVGHEVVLEFKNQYGSTYRAFVFGKCIADPDTDSGCAETD